MWNYNFDDIDIDDLGLLPIVHTCSGIDFRDKVMRNKAIGKSPAPCDPTVSSNEQPSEELVCLFYGIPADIDSKLPNMSAQTSLSDIDLLYHAPVVLILKNEDDATPCTIVRVHPFETRAFLDENVNYRSWIPSEYYELDNFAIHASMEAILKHVRYFFENNERYYNCESHLSPSDPAVRRGWVDHSFVTLICANSCAPLDERRGAIEIQAESVDDLLDKLLAIVATSDVISSIGDEDRTTLEEKGVRLVRYKPYSSGTYSPIALKMAILETVKHYYLSETYLSDEVSS